MTTDFNQLLEQKASEAERPKPLPIGTYRCRISALPLKIESRQKQTPGLQYTFNFVEAMEDVDVDMLAEVTEKRPLPNRTIRETFWLTDDSMYRFTEFLEKLGLDTERNFTEVIPETPGCEVYIFVSQAPSQNDPQVIYNQIDSFASLTE